MDPLIVTQAINVLYGISTLAVLALGLAVIFGLLGVLNIAHGEFVMIGAYCAYMTQAGGLPYVAAIPLTLAVCAVLGVAVEWIMIRPLYCRPFDTLVATWGLSLLLRKAAEAIFGLGYRSVSIPLPGTVRFFGTEYPIYRLLLIAISIAVVAALVIWYGRSRTGSRIRAMVTNPELAQAQGISVRWLAAGTFVTGTFSGGEKKMLSFVRGLAEDQPVVLLDEPSEGVQWENILHMDTLIGEKKSAGTAFIVVEQNLAFAERIADRYLIMDQGRAVLEGSRFEIERSHVLAHLHV
jgi:hypothetical protein